LGQVLTVLLAVIFLGEHPSLQAWSGIVLVILGVSAVIYTKMDSQEGKSGIRGIILGLLSVLCMSIAPIISKNGLAHISTIQGSFVRMFAGTLGVFIFGLFTQQIGGWMQPFKDSRLIGRFLLSVCVITFGGFWLSLVAIKYVDVAIANTLNSTEPIFVLPLTVIFLKEKIALNTAIGTILTMTGIVLLCSS
jgi:drug/metabolite transporter (DMT)-like permease